MHKIMRAQQQFQIFLYIFYLIAAVSSYTVQIRGTGSVLAGAYANYTATLYDGDKVAKNADYLFSWRVNTRPPIKQEFKTTEPYSNWTVVYPKDTKPGLYRVSLVVDKNYVVYINVAENHYEFEVSDSLGGDLEIYQEHVKMPFKFVSTEYLTNHTIELRYNDLRYLENATYVHTYWFENCTYLGMSNDFSYIAHYDNDDGAVDIMALVVGSFEDLPEPTTTTTTTTTSTTPATTSTSTTTSTTPSTTTTLKPKNKTRRRRDAASDTFNAAKATAALLSKNINEALQDQKNGKGGILYLHREMGPQINHFLNYTPPQYNCINRTVIMRDDEKKVYGYFSRYVVPKHPLSDFKINGKSWLQHGDLLNLDITFKGSPNLLYCVLVYDAPYNATGNETCKYFYPLHDNHLNYLRYYSDSKAILFIIRNDISEIRNLVTIKIYEVKVQSQLSVVVVPVSFTLVAVILVVFGVSYYIQSRNRFTVEVADFNFGETSSADLEYKTFQQRLIDSICEALPRRRRYSDSSDDLSALPGQHNGSVDSNLRYNTMT